MASRVQQSVVAFVVGVLAGSITYLLLPVRRVPDCFGNDLYDCPGLITETGGHLRSLLGNVDLSHGSELVPGIWLPILVGLVMVNVTFVLMSRKK